MCLDQKGVLQTEDLDTEMRRSLIGVFSLPSAQDVQNPRNSDLGIDVIVPKFQSGDAWDLSLGEFDIPLWWRPRITVSSRLYYLKTGKTKATFTVTDTMEWSQYVERLCTLRGLLRVRPMFDNEDMEKLLYRACHKLLLKMRNAV